jgi:hypothetical protein
MLARKLISVGNQRWPFAVARQKYQIDTDPADLE